MGSVGQLSSFFSRTEETPHHHSLLPMLPILHNHRNQRDENNGHNHRAKIVFHKWYGSEEVSAKHKQSHPQHPPNNIISQKAQVMHPADARNKRRKASHNRNKTCKH